MRRHGGLGLLLALLQMSQPIEQTWAVGDNKKPAVQSHQIL
jgi:hypothetical protein